MDFETEMRLKESFKLDIVTKAMAMNMPLWKLELLLEELIKYINETKG